MRTIWKFEMPVDESHVLEMPAPGEILAFEADPYDPGVIVAWAIVEPFEDWESELSPYKVTKHYIIHGTGRPIEQALSASEHVATVRSNNTGLVWHVFEVGS